MWDSVTNNFLAENFCYHDSLAYGITASFESQCKARRRFTHPLRTEKAPCGALSVFAEDVGFEPTRSFTLWRFSKPLPSATRPILQ